MTDDLTLTAKYDPRTADCPSHGKVCAMVWTHVDGDDCEKTAEVTFCMVCLAVAMLKVDRSAKVVGDGPLADYLRDAAACGRLEQR